MKNILSVGLVALVLSGLSCPVYAAPYPTNAQDVGVCDPNAPSHCIAPNADGSITISGAGSGGTSSNYNAVFPTAGTAVGFKDSSSGNMVPGVIDNASSGLKVDVVAGGAGGGAVYGPTAVGSAAANPPVLTGGTANATATGNVQVFKVDINGYGGQYVVDAAGTNKLAVNGSGQVTISNTTFTATQGNANAGGSNSWTTQNGVSAVTGTVQAKTVAATSGQLLAAASRQLLAIHNESASASIACNFGGTAALNTAGNFTIGPSQSVVWTSYPVPADAVNCIASSASTPATIEVN